MIIGGKEFKGKTYIMGILNVTPDSFSDGGKFNSVENAVNQARKLAADGADIIDVGGESTRPNYTQISGDEEIARVVPVIERLKKELDIPISIDTYKAKVAKAAVKAGADLVNDIWGLRYDNGDMADLIAKTGVACCLMHNRKNAEYNSFLDDVVSDLKQSLEIAKNAGIAFAKSYEQNLYLTNHLEELTKLGYPVLLGASRKSMIGLALDLPVTERLEGTIAASVIAVMKGCRFIRVHDVLENKRAVQMTEKIINQKLL